MAMMSWVLTVPLVVFHVPTEGYTESHFVGTLSSVKLGVRGLCYNFQPAFHRLFRLVDPHTTQLKLCLTTQSLEHKFRMSQWHDCSHSEGLYVGGTRGSDCFTIGVVVNGLHTCKSFMVLSSFPMENPMSASPLYLSKHNAHQVSS